MIVNNFLILASFGDWWSTIGAALGALLTFTTLLALWPRWKASELAKSWTENKRLQSVVTQMTLENEVKGSVILRLVDDKKKLEDLLIRAHDDKLAEIQRSEIQRSESPARTSGG